MPYCCQCGTQVSAVDRFCAKCGTRQTAGPNSPPPRGFGDGAPNPYYTQGGNFMGGITPRNASLLCYIPWFGWIACVLVLASQRFKHDTIEGPEVRFHAFQGLYLFVAWLIVDWILSPMLSFPGVIFGRGFPHPLGGILHLLILAAWIVMLIKTSQSEHYRLPILGELAERSVKEQRT